MTKIKIRQWLAKKNGFPRIAEVEVLARTQKAVQVKGHGDVTQTVHCMNCARELTHPVSQQVGIGPDCCDNLGIPWVADESPAAVAALRASLVAETEFEGWLPISQIEVLEGSLDAPARTREEKAKPEGVGSLEQAEGRMATFEITDWIAEQKSFPSTLVRLRGKIKRATPKAVLVQVRYTYLRIPEGDEQFWADEAQRDGIKLEDGCVRFTQRKVKTNEIWLPVSQITNVEIDEPRAPARRRPSIKHEKVEPEAPREKTEYEAWSDSMLPF